MTNQYNKKQRIIIHNFLKSTCDNVKLILEDPTKHFYFSRYSKRNEKNFRCMAGWLPEIYPNLITFNGEYLQTKNNYTQTFRPYQIGIPISNKIWTTLTVSNTQDSIGLPNLPRLATFEQTEITWLKIAMMYKNGLLDNEIIQPNKTI